jgi:hypothetical protein
VRSATYRIRNFSDTMWVKKSRVSAFARQRVAHPSRSGFSTVVRVAHPSRIRYTSATQAAYPRYNSVSFSLYSSTQAHIATFALSWLCLRYIPFRLSCFRHIYATSVIQLTCSLLMRGPATLQVAYSSPVENASTMKPALCYLIRV